jgi:protein-L-isoaspartate(D-aspartate) O-methyltransferase
MVAVNRVLPALVIILLFASQSLPAADDYARERQAMIEKIEQAVSQTRHYLDKSAFNRQVMEVMATVPRHSFVPADQLDYAYENRPLPIGHGQTISQPYIVALMTDLIETRPEHRVLEIGTGSAYQAAVLAQLVDQVYSIEIIKPLAETASSRLSWLGYDNVHSRIGDGYYGWPEAGPFDAIVVTAASSHVPPPLISQLKPGGRMVIPVGSRFMTQQLLFVEKDAEGKVFTRQVMPVRFVPLTGQH